VLGVARAGTWTMITKIYKFHNVSPILPILQKDCTTVEWTWWRLRNTNNEGLSPPKFFSKLGPCLCHASHFLIHETSKPIKRSELSFWSPCNSYISTKHSYWCCALQWYFNSVVKNKKMKKCGKYMNCTKYRKIHTLINIVNVSNFCQKFIINWTSTCHSLCQASENRGRSPGLSDQTRRHLHSYPQD